MRSPAGSSFPRGVAGATALLAVTALGAWWFFRAPEPEAPGHDPVPPAPFVSPFLNTGPEARYVGSEACRACHEAATASYLRTGMGRSMAAVGPDQAPPNVAFDHPASGRRYEVYRS